ncbi:MAG: hypothetical protein IKV87_07860 [Methanobrevibacter sp.]|nr:hypothetical protein [Methanobrevibacter sp.]
MSHETFNTLDNHEDIFKIIDKDFLQLYFYQGDVFDINNQIKNFFDIDEKDLDTLKSAHFILSPQVLSFIKALPLLLRNLSHSTNRKDEEMRGHIRGNINWNKTIKARLSLGYVDKTLFVCSPPNKNYNLEENQLIKFLLNTIINLKEHYLPFANPSNYDFDFEKIDEDDDWYTKVRTRYEVCKKTLKKVYFDDIDDINKVSFKHLKKTARHKNFLYSNVVLEVYKLYERLFINKDINVLHDLMLKRIIRSRDSNKLFELYVLSELVKAIPGNSKFNLLHDKNKNGNEIEVVLDNKVWATIYYQRTPDDLENISMYKKICKGYSIGCNVRSPDIILKFEADNKYRIFEVKNTDNENYIRDSIYKVMGYLKDFEGDDGETYLTENYPIILVTYNGINQKELVYENEDIIICNKNEYVENLEKGIFFKK